MLDSIIRSPNRSTNFLEILYMPVGRQVGKYTSPKTIDKRKKIQQLLQNISKNRNQELT